MSVVTAPSGDTDEAKEIQREELFTKFDKPFGLEQDTYNILWIGPGHLLAGYIFYLNFTGSAPWSIVILELFIGYMSGMGLTVGCHRYWTHKTFKATLPLQFFLMICQTMCNQYPIHKWSLDHRIHHKYVDTHADPHNSKRGFLFSHMGWLFLPKRKELQQKLKTFDMSDLENDPIVRFQCKWYYTLVAIFHVIMPTAVVYYFWRLPLLYCFASNCRRYVMSLHATWTVNSFAHMWGDKPYDKSLTSTQNWLVSLVSAGEGWHNYHHTFPWDYKTSEFGWKINLSTIFIDVAAYFGLAYDMKSVSQKMLKERLRRTGDGSHAQLNSSLDCGKDGDDVTPADITELMKSVDKPIWGWDDDTIPEDFRKATQVMRRRE